MPPSGEGVNTAMLDALDLIECLTSGEFNNLPAAMAAYEAQMLARAAILGEEALDSIHDFASPSDASVKKLIEQFTQE
jgi:2-polyprenyl-6-methoxyphenol hydroxylase-like FAD-dependent oxidoreductase